MSLFDEKVKTQLRQILAKLSERVNLLYFTQELECGTCKDTHSFLDEIISLSDKLGLTVFDFVKDKEKADFYKVERIPAILFLDSKNNDTGIRFYGMPAGYEINSFIQSLIEVSGVRQPLPAQLASRAANIAKDIHIQVFVSLTCPYCPNAVSAAHRLAIESQRVTADMVDTTLFPQLAVKYSVSAVPKTIINESHELIGAQPIEKLLEVIEKI